MHRVTRGLTAGTGASPRPAASATAPNPVAPRRRTRLRARAVIADAGWVMCTPAREALREFRIAASMASSFIG